MEEREQAPTGTLGDSPTRPPSPVTLTFLIADVRGYTSFTRERGDAAAAVLATKFADLAREAVEARSGRVIELRGDEALAVFSSAPQAVRAAVEFQATCAEESRAEPAFQLPIGIGIDAGEAIPVEDGYRGVALNMAARLCSSAGAGQIFVTRTVTDLCEGVEDVVFAERGVATFKGFEEPVEVIEALATARRAADHGAARAPSPPRAPEPLPPELDPLTPLVDRERELLWLRGTWRQTRRGHGRVLLVSGPEQIGKTRLAAEMAARVNDDGGTVRYAGPGGAGTALALAAIRGAMEERGPTLLVLDDIDVAGQPVADALTQAYEKLSAAPVLALGLLRDPHASPSLATLVERVDARGDGHRRLAPLDLDGVRNVLRLYVGEDVDDAPVESIARSSGGVPGRIHEVASDWARGEASRRLAAAAEWLAAGRDRRAADLEFANNVIGLKLGRLYSVEGRDVLREERTAVCPYRGLAPFDAADAPYFFGRERLVGELAARTVQSGLLAVVGPSGSGKSSLIAAGLLPSLAAGLLPGSERWRHVVIRPGERPMHELRSSLASKGFQTGGDDPLASALESVERDGRMVMIVDQFEELFTTTGEEEREVFVRSLVRAAAERAERGIVVLTIRADFYGHCAAYPQLAELMGGNHVLVGPMGPQELRRAIELPARRVGLRVESTLADALVAEVEDEPGGLPLLSTALVELWQLRSDGWLRMESHERTGGVSGAVARLAESSFDQLEGEEREASRAILLRLVTQGEGDAVVRRRVPLDEFDRTPAVEAVLKRFTEDRLITAGEGTVEVAHEALIREWPRLRGWLDEDAQGRQLRAHLTQASRHWVERDRDAAELYRGARLSATLDWAAPRGRELNELEREFLSASREAGELEAQRQRRTNRRLRGLLAGVALFLIVALVAGALALVQRGKARRSATEARHSATVALGKSLGAQAVVEPRLDTALLLARESVKLAANQQTRSTFLSTLLRSPAAIGALYGDGNRPLFISLSPDQHVLAIAENTETILFRDTRTGSYAYPAIKRFNVQGILYAPDGTLVVPRVDEGFAVTGIDVMDPSSSRVVRTFPVPKPPSADASLSLFAMRFSPDGRKLAIAFSNPDDDAATSDVVQWDFESGRLVGPVISLPWVTNGGLGYFSPDATMIATGPWDGHVQLWNAATGRQVGKAMKASDGAVTSVQFSPDGHEIVTGGTDGTTRLFDVSTQRQIGSEFPGQGGWVFADFTPDGSSIVVNLSSGWSDVWPATVEGWAQHACAVVRRSFTRAEWDQFVPGHPYEKVCPGVSSS